ncbi:hypothetical protein Ancab_031672 [Ancistrocladus abbreviatus]
MDKEFDQLVNGPVSREEASGCSKNEARKSPSVENSSEIADAPSNSLSDSHIINMNRVIDMNEDSVMVEQLEELQERDAGRQKGKVLLGLNWEVKSNKSVK